MKRRSFLQMIGLAPIAASCAPVRGEAEPVEMHFVDNAGEETTDMVFLTAQEYEELDAPDPQTLYIIAH